MSEREHHSTTLDAVFERMFHEMDAHTKGINPLPGHPGRGRDILDSGRSRLYVKADKDMSRTERERLVWERAVAEYEKGQKLCESPIERELLAALLTADWGYFFTENAVVHDIKDEAFPREPVVIVPQLQVARYRLDFAIVLHKERRHRILAVECDGRDFHDRERDLQRDLYLEGLGIPTVRRTGQRINAEPLAVANELSVGIAHWWEAQ